MATIQINHDDSFHPIPTLQEAVAAMADSADAENVIEIIASPIIISEPVELGIDFGANRKLAIRPGPNLRRAVIASVDVGGPGGGRPIFSGGSAGYVTLQDLDIVRNITNRYDLVILSDCYEFIIERCRIGSIWRSPGAEGWSNLRIARPTGVIVRNSIFFAYCPGTLDSGIQAELATAQNNSLLLYNNVVADYKEFGIHVTGGGDAVLILRNNVVLNHPETNPEPIAYHSAVAGDMTVETSHNAAFVSLAEAETIAPGAQTISGVDGADFLRRSRAQVEDAFVRHTWVIDPAWDSNIDFFRLVRGGPLHSEPADAGVNVYEQSPHDKDVAVTDDIEKDPRPAGIPMHTDRGADQIREDDTFLDLDALVLIPSVLAGGKEGIGKVMLNGIAPKDGWEIKLSSTNPAATVPASVIIPGGAASQTFRVTTKPVKTIKTGKVTATYRNVSRSRSLTVRPIGVASVKLYPASVVRGMEITGMVVLECAAGPKDIKVALESSSTRIIIPKYLTIPAGEVSGTFPVRIKPVLFITSVTITATANGVSKKATLKIKPH